MVDSRARREAVLQVSAVLVVVELLNQLGQFGSVESHHIQEVAYFHGMEK